MSAIHDVLRYLLERVPHSTQDEHDRIAAVIDEHEQQDQGDAGATAPAVDDDGADTPTVQEEETS